ncbi:MAG: hypothetical protein SO206_01165 [Bacilli bacterium]|nr:hypothetical protein [Bacilli bacterium]
MKKALFTSLLVAALTLVACGNSNSEGIDTPQSPTNYTVTWKNWNGTILEIDTNVEKGTMPHYDSAIPTKPEDEEYSYSFKEWAPSLIPVTEDAIYIATFTSTKKEAAPNVYTVTWKNWDGSTLEYDTDVEEGTMPHYDGATPTKPEDSEYTYSFKGWTPTLAVITENATYIATYDSTKKEVAPNTYTVTWKNWNGSVLRTDENIEEGTTPDYGNNPDDFCWLGSLYTFSAWSPTPAPIYSNTTYTAGYSKVTDLSSATILEKDELDPYELYIYLQVGETHTFRNSLYDTSANKYFKWESGDETIFTVNENGVVEGLKEGQTDLYLKTIDNYPCDSVRVIITNPSSNYIDILTNSINEVTLLMGYPYTFIPTSNLSTFDNYKIIIEDEEIASLSGSHSTGFVLTPNKIGCTTMYARSGLGIVSDTVTITVTQIGCIGLQYFRMFSSFRTFPTFETSTESADLCECDYYQANVYNFAYSSGWKDGDYSCSYKVIANLEITDYEISYYKSVAQKSILITANIKTKITNYDWSPNCHYGYSSLASSFTLLGNVEDGEGNVVSSSEITISQSDNNNTKIISITGNPSSISGPFSFFIKSKLNQKS